MGFADDLARFSMTVKARNQAIFVGVVAETKNSIQFGSALTGAPGQPVDEGDLRGSWQVAFEGPTTALVSTDKLYAEDIEHGTSDGRALTLRSSVGGFHSVEHTRANFPRIVAAETAKAGGTP